LFNSRPGGMQGVVDAILLFLHLDFGRGTHLDHRYATGQLGDPLLQLLAIVVAGGLLNLSLDRLDTLLDTRLVAGAADDDGILLVHLGARGTAQVLQRGLVQLLAGFLGDDRRARQDGDVLQHGLAPIAKPRRLDREQLEHPAHGVNHQRRQGFALDVLSNDEQRLARLGGGFQHGQQVAYVGDLLVVQEHQRIIQRSDLFFRIIDEIRTEIAAVELHALDHVQFVVQRLAVLDRDHALLANLFHRVGNDLANGFVCIGGQGGYLRDLFTGGDGLGQILEFVDNGRNCLVHAALQVHGIQPCGHVAHAFLHDGLRQYGGRRGAVAGHVSRLGCYLFDHLRAYVLELALEFDLLGDRDAVLSDDGRTETALQQHVAPLGSKGNLDGVSQYVYTLDDAGTGVIMKKYVFRTHVCTPVSLKRGSGGLLQGLSVGLNNRQHVVLAHDQILFAIDFDSLSRILAKQD